MVKSTSDMNYLRYKYLMRITDEMAALKMNGNEILLLLIEMLDTAHKHLLSLGMSEDQDKGFAVLMRIYFGDVLTPKREGQPCLKG